MLLLFATAAAAICLLLLFFFKKIALIKIYTIESNEMVCGLACAKRVEKIEIYIL